MRKIAIFLVLATALARCGGGGSTSTSTPTPTPTPTSNACVGEVCPWEMNLGGSLLQANLTMNQGTINVEGSPYYVGVLGGWPGQYPAGTPGVSPANQYQSFDLTGTLTGDSVSMLWTWVNNPNPKQWQYEMTGTFNSTNNSVSGNLAFDNGIASQTFTGAERTAELPMTYSGTIATFENSCLVSPGGKNCPSLGNDTVQATFATDGSFNITATLVVTGVNDDTYTLSGPMIGNTMQLSGILGSQQVELVAYYDVKGAYGGSAQSLIVFQMAYPISTQATETTTYGYNGTLNPIN